MLQTCRNMVANTVGGIGSVGYFCKTCFVSTSCLILIRQLSPFDSTIAYHFTYIQTEAYVPSI
jgi:hypothetical protein